MTKTLVLGLAGALTLSGCGGVGTTSPSPSPVTTAITFAVFIDRESGVSTTEVRDVHDQIVRFNSEGELVWMATDARFPGFLADDAVVTAYRVCTDCYFLVRFATRNGERRAYLTWSGDPPPDRAVTILDVDVVGGRLVVAETDVPLARSSGS